ncbi:hypothetical protein SAMN05421734_10115 [Pelagirhabdus alkalitolerans]|uniref:Uncharacterized protein n=1 Tax=Pelagirhabdus alkalitolerans TaxID=1612202 RepID=A0A1G6GGE5_9BACI|nr:hypothetical protein [Pelagirhabdus alkalitolerans]SDB80903.1 hypothetical protein SAMN05421734_10115 [Pelagirhabdus alkalitolerans]
MKRQTIFASIAGVVLLVVLALITVPMMDDDATSPAEDHPDDQTTEQEQVEDGPDLARELDEETADQLLSDYEQVFLDVVDNVDDEQYAVDFDTQQEVHDHFKQVMTPSQSQTIFLNYFEADDQGVYVIPMDGKTFINPDEDYELTERGDERYTIEQTQSNPQMGTVTFRYDIRYSNDQEAWLIRETESEQIEDTDAEEVAENVIHAIDDQDMSALADWTHTSHGILFSPYVNVSDEDLIFSEAEIANFDEDDEIYTWGVYDGRGDDIDLTPEDYFDEFLPTNLLIEPDDIYVNEFSQHGNVLNNIDDYFPDATVVEYHHEGTDEYDGMDWFSIHVVLEENEHGQYRVVALVSDQWTI